MRTATDNEQVQGLSDSRTWQTQRYKDTKVSVSLCVSFELLGRKGNLLIIDKLPVEKKWSS